MTQDLAVIKHGITTAFSVCDSCDRTFPSGYTVCRQCCGRLRHEGKLVQASSAEQLAVPITTIWTTECQIDELYRHLSIVEEVHGENVRFRKYLCQAEELIYRIPISRPIPPFIINLSDLPEWMVKQLESCNKRTLEYVVKSAVGRIFEAINLDYYTISVARSLQVKIQP